MNQNFMQVGRTVKCGHCDPQFQEGLRFAEQQIPNYRCDCKCHDSMNTKETLREEWADRNLEILKKNDYIIEPPDRKADADWWISKIEDLIKTVERMKLDQNDHECDIHDEALDDIIRVMKERL